MTRSLRHRGPDDMGVWVKPEAGVGMGHCRLAIIDLSPTGHQPMVSRDGHYVLCFNGEIYNFKELRKELEQSGCRFHGQSDTEVILKSCEAVGVEKTLERIEGMFAFALWDNRRRRMVLARDRVGIKPLYWGRFNHLFIFGSELKALRAHPGWQPEISRAAVTAYLRFLYVPAPLSIYEGVFKLEPGQYLTYDTDGTLTLSRYWDAKAMVCESATAPMDLSDGEAEERLDEVLRKAVARQMVSDVPLGTLLSGGIDSSAVTAIMQACSSRPVKTFSIGFNYLPGNEAPFAAEVAKHLGTDHTELYVDAEQARAVIPLLDTLYDEPFADSSGIPTFLLAKLARQQVRVALSGDGGDELFAGYRRYLRAVQFRRRYGRIPRWVASRASKLIRSVPSEVWESLWALAPSRLRPSCPADRMEVLASDLSRADWLQMYLRYVTSWDPSACMVTGSGGLRNDVWDPRLTEELPGFLECIQYIDFVTYLPDDILTKVDRATMAVGLEARVPLLDEKAVGFVWRLPRRMKLRHGITKWLLRRVLSRYVPTALFERPKMGFSIPLGMWLRGPLREWSESYLSASRLAESGLFRTEVIRLKWQQHLEGRGNMQDFIWPILMFQTWAERWKT